MTTKNKKTPTTIFAIAGLAVVIAGLSIVPALSQQYVVASISCTGTSTCNGTAGDDVMIGDSANNVMNGLGGNDQMHGMAGDDTMHGNDGNDIVLGYEGNDSVYGDDGTDTVQGDAGADYVDGGAGNNDRARQNNSSNDADGSNDTTVGGTGTGDWCYKKDAGDSTGSGCETIIS